MKKHEFILKGLDCANCANKIQDKLAKNLDYKNVIVNFNTLKLSFESEIEDVKEDVEKIVKSVEPEVEIVDLKNSHNAFYESNKKDCKELEHNHEHKHNDNCESKKHGQNSKENDFEKRKNIKKENTNLVRLIAGIILMLVCMSKILPDKIYFITLIFSYIILLYRVLKNSIKLLKQKVIDENLLITISCIGALIIGEELEGLMVIVLYEIGKILEEKAINNTRRSISELMNIRPEYANLKCETHNNEEHEHDHSHDKHENSNCHEHNHSEQLNNSCHEHKVNPENVKINDIIIIKQGEKIPLDGIVVTGTAQINMVSLTGETKLKEVKVDDKVLSGSINEDGLIEVRVTEKYENSTVSQILKLVENATDKKAKTETFVSKASRIYTPIVIVLSIIVALILPLLCKIPFSESIYRALIFLVVSCPCAIAISVPLSYFSGIGKASKNGILIKGSNYLDALKDVKYIAFDKTGTLTKGSFEVEKINSYDSNFSEEMVLDYAAKGEIFSNHPLSKAILEKYGKNVDKTNVTEFNEVSGKGITYKYNSKIVKIGNSEFTDANERDNKLGTAIYVSVDNKLVGSLILNDIVKEETREVISKLNTLNIETVMYTGDNLEVAKKIAEDVGIKNVKAEMLPTDKYKEIENVLNSKDCMVTFVGDGINDSPVLALADIGISMGGIGASSAIEASDIVIMNDDLRKILEGIRISKYTNKIIKQNLIFALTVKILVLLLSVIGVANMALAVFADVGVTLITILNTIRILKRK